MPARSTRPPPPTLHHLAVRARGAASSAHLRAKAGFEARRLQSGRLPALFRVVGVEAQRDPVYFQAWIEESGQGPSGYSDKLAVRFLDRD
jgi:hypothetical protein